jgi:hypothetical protein
MDEKPRQIMEARPEGRRTRAKPRKIYIDEIEETANNGTEVTELRTIAGGRRD